MTHDHSNADLPAALRMQLRGLRTDAPPTRDLWPGIAARLAEQPRTATEPSASRPGLRALPAFAAAAVLALAVGLGWQLSIDRDTQPALPAAPLASTTSPAPAEPPPLVRQANAMTREYQGALREVTAAQPLAGEHPELQQLDTSANEVLDALRQAPDAGYLLHRLQRIYVHRLDLTRRLAQA